MSLSAAKKAYRKRPEVKAQRNAWLRDYRQSAEYKAKERARAARRRAASGGQNQETLEITDRYVLRTLFRTTRRPDGATSDLIQHKREHLILHRLLRDLETAISLHRR